MKHAMLIALSVTLAVAQQNSDGGEARNQIHLTEEIRMEEASTQAAFVAVIKNTGLAGGIISQHQCNTEAPRSIVLLAGMSLNDALDLVVSAHQSHSWTMSGGVVDVLPNKEVEVMKVNVKYFEWDRADTLQYTLQRVFNLPSIEARLAQLGLTSGLQSLTVLSSAPVVRDGKPNVSARGDIKHVENSTLLSTLNAIASSYGNKVWSYQETRCGADKTFRVGVD